jgi:hypothetical protein
MLDKVADIYNPSTQEAEAGGSWVQSHPRLYNETLSQTKQSKTNKATKTSTYTEYSTWQF